MILIKKIIIMMIKKIKEIDLYLYLNLIYYWI
jgi:hypothetical protein